MANQEQVARLLRSVEEWNDWRSVQPAEEFDIERPEVIESQSSIDLEGADLEGADLSGADLLGANLRAASLRSVSLDGARLDGADLREAALTNASAWKSKTGHRTSFRMSNLSGACLRNATLHHADFGGAILLGTNWSEARLEGAVFHGSNLAGSSFFGSTFGATNYGGLAVFRGGGTITVVLPEAQTLLLNVNLGRALDLKSVRHSGRSSIDVQTIYRSEGRIPESFLRGAGIPENLVRLARGLAAPSAIELYSCFISYSHDDKAFARRLHDELQGRGVRCWLDEHDLLPGQRVLDVVDRAIRSHDRLMLCCSQASLESWWVRDEIRKALERERQEGRDVIVPLNLDCYLLDDWEDGLAADLRSRLAADFTGWATDNDKFERELERVLEALRHEVPR